MDAHPVVCPQLLHAGLRHLNRAAPGAVSRTQQQDSVIAPDGQRDIQVPRRFVRMRPQQLSVIRIKPRDNTFLLAAVAIVEECDKLILPVHFDQHR